MSQATKVGTERTQQIRVRRVGLTMERRRGLGPAWAWQTFYIIVLFVVGALAVSSVVTPHGGVRDNLLAWALYALATAGAVDGLQVGRGK